MLLPVKCAEKHTHTENEVHRKLCQNKKKTPNHKACSVIWERGTWQKVGPCPQINQVFWKKDNDLLSISVLFSNDFYNMEPLETATAKRTYSIQTVLLSSRWQCWYANFSTQKYGIRLISKTQLEIFMSQFVLDSRNIDIYSYESHKSISYETSN